MKVVIVSAAMLVFCLGCSKEPESPVGPVEQPARVNAATVMQNGFKAGTLAHLFGKSVHVRLSMGGLVEVHREVTVADDEEPFWWSLAFEAPLVDVEIEGDPFLDRMADSFSGSVVRVGLGRPPSSTTTAVVISLRGKAIQEGTFFMSLDMDLVLDTDEKGFPVLADFETMTGTLMFVHLDLQNPGMAEDLIFGRDTAAMLTGLH